VRIHLAGIDAPEGRQPYGSGSQQELSALSFHKQVRVEVQDTDRYGRTVGRVFARPLDVNAELVRRGAAWVYPKIIETPHCQAWKPQPARHSGGSGLFPSMSGSPPGCGAMASSSLVRQDRHSGLLQRKADRLQAVN
jgi:hypothetical protein